MSVIIVTIVFNYFKLSPHSFIMALVFVYRNIFIIVFSLYYNNLSAKIVNWCLFQVKSKYHKPTSLDSELQALRERLFQQSTILASPTHLTATPREAITKARGESVGVVTTPFLWWNHLQPPWTVTAP